jgi:hypothetical protein
MNGRFQKARAAISVVDLKRLTASRSLPAHQDARRHRQERHARRSHFRNYRAPRSSLWSPGSIQHWRCRSLPQGSGRVMTNLLPSQREPS